MQDIYQKTLAKEVIFSGVGLHSGKLSTIKLKPAKDDCGIVFRRIDLKENNTVKADFRNVSSAKLCTTLMNKYGVKVSTVEHLLAALYISEIDNALIDINSEEVPIMDGSAKDFIETLKKTGLKSLTKKRKYLKVLDRFEFTDKKRTISIEPTQNSFEVDFQLNYKNDLIGQQKNVVNFQQDNLSDVSSSRTFCLYEDIEEIKKAGLAKGGSLENAVVIKDNEVINEGGLRNKKEFVNHKILDLAGDFLLSGYRVLGKIKCIQGGHELTNLFLREMFNKKSIFSIEEKSNQLVSKGITTKSSVKLAVNA